MTTDSVSRREHDAHQKTCEERFGRDKERIEKSEAIIDELKTVSVRLGIIIEQHDNKLVNHDERLDALEKKPAKRWDSVVGKTIEYVIAFVIAALLVFLGLKDKL